MYIIFKFGNKQYKAQQGELIDVDFIKSKISLKISILNTLLILEKDKIILNHIKLKTYEIIAFVRFQIKLKKITLLKFKRRKHSMKKSGHRQKYTQIQIHKIKIKNLKKNK